MAKSRKPNTRQEEAVEGVGHRNGSKGSVTARVKRVGGVVVGVGGRAQDALAAVRLAWRGTGNPGAPRTVHIVVRTFRAPT